MQRLKIVEESSAHSLQGFLGASGSKDSRSRGIPGPDEGFEGRCP